MVTIVILVAAALIFGYSRRYPTDRLIGIGIAGMFAGLLLFGAQAAFASQPKVPCWSEMKGMTQFLRAMPFACQETSPARR
jgi:hypothetical protein